MLLLATCTPLGQVGPESWSQAPAPCPGAGLALAQSPTTWFLSPAYAQEKRKNSLVDATFALHHAVLTRRVLTYTFPQVLGFLFFFLVTQNLHFFKSEGNQSNTYGHSQRHSIELSFPQVATEDGANHADQEPQQLGDKLGWEEEETVR